MTMPQLISDLFTADLWWSYLFRIGLYLLLAWIVHRLAHRAARRLQALSRFTPPRYRVRPERGKLLAWNNLNPDGTPNMATMHHAMKVRKGLKYVITRWYQP